MKKNFTLLTAVVCGLALNAKTLYLNPNDDWKKDGARFAIYAFDNSQSLNEWYDMSAISGGYYQATVDDKYPTVIFCRMNGSASENKWENKWNQTQDMAIEADKNLCNIGGWDNAGSWSVYSEGQGGGDNPGGGGQGGGESTGEHDYYLKGFCNGADITTPTAEEQFEAGVLTYTFTGDGNGMGYFFILVCEAGQVVGECYMAKQFTTENHCTLYNEQKEGASQKMGVPAGTVTFYLYDNGDGSLELSTVELQGKTLVGGGSGEGGEGGGQGGGDNPGGQGQDAVDNVTTPTVITKTIENGQVVIIKNGIRFNLLGAQLH